MKPIAELTVEGRHTFDRQVVSAEGRELDGLSLQTVQVNINLNCNLACHHCHVESSPARTEQMSWATMAQVLDAARRCQAQTLDITGGAPEMHPDFARFVDAAVAQGLHVIVRTNLTILLQPGYTHLPRFMAERRLHLIASLPCYLETNVDKQRGRHVYRDSVEAIRVLNALGYGIEPHLPLDLVYNPGGPSLPPPQQALEADYRRELKQRFDLQFTRLLTITNMPIGRFLHDLERAGKAQAYQQKLRDAFNPDTLQPLMCRHQIHVGWDGRLYDCDFNYGIALPALGPVTHIADFDPQTFRTRRIATGEHCFGCTAGSGSSCGGALA